MYGNPGHAAPQQSGASAAASPVPVPHPAKRVAGPNDHDAHRPPKEWEVQRQQQQAGDQHPEPQHRQEPEEPAHHEQQADRNPQPPRRRLAQPSQAASRPTRKQSLPAIEVNVQSPLVSVCHAYTVPCPRSPAREWLAGEACSETPWGTPRGRPQGVQRRPALIFASLAAPGQSSPSPSVLNATAAVSRCACRSGASGSTYSRPVTISPRAWQACR